MFLGVHLNKSSLFEGYEIYKYDLNKGAHLGTDEE